MPTPRTPAQAAASRLNGAKSHGPATPEGKARACRNALQHGLRAAGHVLLPEEDADAYHAMHENLLAEFPPATESEAHLVERLACAMWKRRRVDRMEQALFAWAPATWINLGPDHKRADAAACFDLARYNGLQRSQAALAREVDRLLVQLGRIMAGRGVVESVPSEPEEHVGTSEPEQPAAAELAKEPETVPGTSEPEPMPCFGTSEPESEPEPVPVAASEPAPREFSPALRAEIEAMILSGDPERVMAGAARAGILGNVLARVRTNPALGRLAAPS